MNGKPTNIHPQLAVDKGGRSTENPITTAKGFTKVRDARSVASVGLVCWNMSDFARRT